MIHPLDGPRLKVGRANMHLEALKEQVEGFLEGNPYGVFPYYDGYTDKCILRAEVHTPPPQEWGIIIGDIAHNLRSALDQVVWQLALLQTTTPYNRTAFPIFTTRDKYRNNGGRLVQNLATRQEALIKWLQPYRRGNKAESDLLWLLQDVNNTDKHRVIQTVGTVLGFQGHRFRNMQGFMPQDVNVHTGTRLENGAPVADFTFVQTSRNAHMEMHPNFTFDIEFSEGSSAVEGMALLPTLSDILAHVEGIIPMFDRFF